MKVYFGSGFWKHRGRDHAGTEIQVDKRFTWNQREWFVPAVYVCAAGLVIDFCIEIEPERIRSFFKKAEKFGFDETRLSEEERDALENESPMNIDFGSKVYVNGKVLRLKSGYNLSWIPQSCRREEMGVRDKSEMQELMAYYHLDAERGWLICRQSFPWDYKRKPVVKKLSITLEPRAASITALKFSMPKVGEKITVVHPTNGVKHVITVKNIEPQTMNANKFPREELEYPTNFMMMMYTVTPDLTDSEFCIADCRQSDEPRRKPIKDVGQGNGKSGACAIGLIMSVKKSAEELHAACSGLRFEPIEVVEWKAVFRVKLCEAIDVELIG